MQERIPERSEIDVRDTWRLEDLFASDEAWQQALEQLVGLTGEAAAFAGTLGASAGQLLRYLQFSERAGQLMERLAHYAEHRSNEDTRVAKYQDMYGRFASVCVQYQTATAFDLPELMAIADETLEDFYRAEPALELYRRYLTVLRDKRAHGLSDPEEMLLAAAGEMALAPEKIYSVFADADATFADAVDAEGGRHPLSQGTFVLCEQSEDRALRKSAYENFYREFHSYRNTIAAALNAQAKQLQFFAQARRYGSALEASLSATRVPGQVYHTLIDTVHRHLDKMHRYVRLRKKLLGVDELHFYDVYAPLVSGADEHIPFAEACRTVREALAPLGREYQDLLQEGFDNRWIDVYQNVGKRSGAYSAGAHVHPYVLLNYNGTLDAQFTLAHEMGHALHSCLSNRTQPFIYSDYVIFVAEVASTCNEALLMQYLLARTDEPKKRAYLINYFLEQFKSTLYRQTMFAEFELRCGEMCAQGQTLTADALCALYKDLNAQYFGPDMVVDDEIALEWARIPHFYMNYYVFQYATGYAAAIALSRRILSGGEQEREDYLNFLSGGCSKDPIDLLRGAGVDMTTAEPIEKALSLFSELLDEMESLQD